MRWRRLLEICDQGNLFRGLSYAAQIENFQLGLAQSLKIVNKMTGGSQNETWTSLVRNRRGVVVIGHSGMGYRKRPDNDAVLILGLGPGGHVDLGPVDVDKFLAGSVRAGPRTTHMLISSSSPSAIDDCTAVLPIAFCAA